MTITLLSLMLSLAPVNLQSPDTRCTSANMHETASLETGMQYCDGTRWLTVDFEGPILTVGGFHLVRFNRIAYVADGVSYTEQVEMAASRECPINVSNNSINCTE